MNLTQILLWLHAKQPLSFFLRHLFNKLPKKHIAGAKTIQTLRHAMTIAPEAEIKLKKYEGLNYDDPSVMQISSILQSEVMAIQGQIHHLGNI